VGLAISAAVLPVVSYVDKGLPVVIITVFIVCLFAGLWFALPLARRRSRFPQLIAGDRITRPAGGSGPGWQ
jgi:hypothetical protein